MALGDVPGKDVIYAIMENIVDSIVQVYTDAEESVPDRHVLSVGLAPHDCEQINVSLDQLYIGGPGDQAEQPMRCEAPRTVSFTVQIVRCIPTPVSRAASVTPEAQGLSTQQLATDFWLLLEGLMAAEAVQFLGALADVTASPPSGAYQAVQSSFVVGIP